MNEPYRTVRLERVDYHVPLVTLDRPDAANALNTAMGEDLHQLLWSRLYLDQGDVRCVVLTGAGERAFCAGGYL